MFSDDFKIIRQSVIDMVMATEMKQHFEHLAKFENSFNKRHVIMEDGTSSVRTLYLNLFNTVLSHDFKLIFYYTTLKGRNVCGKIFSHRSLNKQ